MSDDLLEKILKAQKEQWNSIPKLIQRPALPPIAPKTTSSIITKNDSPESRPATSTSTRLPITSIGFSPLPKPGTLKPLEPIAEKPKTPIYPIPRANISFTINLNDIDNDEILRPDSVVSTEMGSDRDRKVIRQELKIPKSFSEFREISVDLDQITSEDIEKMKETAKGNDRRNTGVISIQAVLAAVRTVHPSDTWQHLLDWMIAIHMETEEKEEILSSHVIFLLDYQLFFKVLQYDKQSREALINIPDVLESDDAASVFSHLPSRPTSSQEQREKGRVMLLVELQIILSDHPEIDIERFKSSIDKKIISVEELKMLFQIYGLADHIKHIEQRIIDCFLTHDHFFCFSAFVGCLNQINPSIFARHSPVQIRTPPWAKPALQKLDDSGFIADIDGQSGSSS